MAKQQLQQQKKRHLKSKFCIRLFCGHVFSFKNTHPDIFFLFHVYSAAETAIKFFSCLSQTSRIHIYFIFCSPIFDNFVFGFGHCSLSPLISLFRSCLLLHWTNVLVLVLLWCSARVGVRPVAPCTSFIYTLIVAALLRQFNLIYRVKCTWSFRYLQ